jgi:diphosphomevalonate decarboxylase
MHADALAADPPLLYWEPATIACLQALRLLRDKGVSVWATIDAGPHVVAICAPADAKQVETKLRAASGVKDVLVCAPAGAARLAVPM